MITMWRVDSDKVAPVQIGVDPDEVPNGVDESGIKLSYDTHFNHEEIAWARLHERLARKSREAGDALYAAHKKVDECTMAVVEATDAVGLSRQAYCARFSGQERS